MNPMKMMKQVQKMQADMERMQKELGAKEFEASAGGGAVKAIATGSGDVKSVKLDEDLVKDGDVEIIEDLVQTAVQEAIEKGRAEMQKEMSKLTAGLPIPPGLGF